MGGWLKWNSCIQNSFEGVQHAQRINASLHFVWAARQRSFHPPLQIFHWILTAGRIQLIQTVSMYWSRWFVTFVNQLESHITLLDFAVTMVTYHSFPFDSSNIRYAKPNMLSFYGLCLLTFWRPRFRWISHIWLRRLNLITWVLLCFLLRSTSIQKLCSGLIVENWWKKHRLKSHLSHRPHFVASAKNSSFTFWQNCDT